MGSLVWKAQHRSSRSEEEPRQTFQKHFSCGMADTDIAPAGGYQFPMVRYTDMDEDMKKEVMEICNTACDNHAANNELCAKNIKEVLDKKFGPSWHVIVGEGFGFEISYETKKMFYMFSAGCSAVCVWKCS